jgi:hypothetical protein
MSATCSSVYPFILKQDGVSALSFSVAVGLPMQALQRRFLIPGQGGREFHATSLPQNLWSTT